MATPLPVDIDLTNGPRYIPCEYRLLHIATNKFIGASKDENVPNMVDDWQEASYFASRDHHEPSEEGTLLFQWNWMMEEACETWMSDANMHEYRVHVLIGESGC